MGEHQNTACGYPYSGKRAVTQTKLTLRQTRDRGTTLIQRRKYSVPTAGADGAAFSDTV